MSDEREKLYRIKPLAWETLEHDAYIGYFAKTPFGTYLVEKLGRIRWKPLDSEVSNPCDSIEHGKQLAEAHWRERLAAALEEA